jgi:biotin carboxyl carrier protein
MENKTFFTTLEGVIKSISVQTGDAVENGVSY